MTAVVLAGDFPSTGILQATVAQRFDLGGGDDVLPVFIDHMAHALRQRGAVLVIYPSWRAEPAHRLVRLARSALLTDRIGGLALDAPPLALSLIADQLTFASSYARPGVLASLAHRLRESVYTGAWVNSVARLERIKTGLGAHVSSYLPGAGFSVTVGPHAGVHRITSAKPVSQPASRPVDPVLMLVSDENGDMEWLQSKLRPMLAAVSMTTVATQPMSAEFWGTKKFTEFVAFSGHPQALQTLLASSAYRPCGWCEEPINLPQCPLCLMVQPGADTAFGSSAPTHGMPPANPPQPPSPPHSVPPAPMRAIHNAQRSGIPQSRSQAPQPVRAPAVRQRSTSAEPPVNAWSERWEVSEAPPTRPEVPQHGEKRSRQSRLPQRTEARPLHPGGDDPAPPRPGEGFAAPTRREPLLAAPVELPADGRADTPLGPSVADRQNGGSKEDPEAWGNSAPLGSRHGDTAAALEGTAESAEQDETADAAGGTTEPERARPQEESSSTAALLGTSTRRQSVPPAPPIEQRPERRPDNEWPRADTVVFRSRRSQ